MRRYKLALDIATEDPDGKWVKWEDVEGILQYKDQLKGFKLEGERRECNCEEMANKPDYEDHPDGLSPLPIHLPPFWICPAHGYKKR